MPDRPREQVADARSNAAWKLAAVIPAIVAVGLFVFSACLLVRHAVQSIRIAFAEDMTDIFAEMRTRALQGNVGEAIRCLDYVVNYYPSGTKLPTGSRLDRIVERERAQAVKDIVARLRRLTGEDLGDDPARWTQEFAGQSEIGFRVRRCGDRQITRLVCRSLPFAFPASS